MNRSLSRLLLFALVVSACAPLSARHPAASGAEAYYDELRDGSGKLRPQYEEIYPLYAELKPLEKEKIEELTRAALEGDNAIHALPRIFTAQEFDNVIRPGVEQRARALRAFLQDYYSGTHRYSRAGIVKKSVVDAIIKR